MLIVNIGFDSIDTPSGGCTTHYASLLLKEWIKRRNFELIDYPNLIRLNPAIPWKTRGNGSVVLRARVEDEREAIDYFEDSISALEAYLGEYSGSDWAVHSEPAIAMYIGDPHENGLLKWFSEKAICDLVPLSLLDRVVDKLSGRVKFRALKTRRGLIGCLAGIGYRMIDSDYTYELIAYRSAEYFGSERKIDVDSVVEMDRLYSSETLLNYDYEASRQLVAPRGPDPILLGIRGEDPEALMKAFKVLRIHEPVQMLVVYRTNQHTDAHLKAVGSLSEAYIYRSVRARAVVSSKPRRLAGGHVLFRVTDGRSEIDVMVYEPAGSFRDVVERLEAGDVVEVMGPVRPYSSRHGAAINLEKIRVIELKQSVIFENPICPKCSSRMKSAGRGKGFKCVKCGFKSKSLSKVARVVRRDLEPGWYEPPPRAFKHLMKPIKRLGRERSSFPKVFKPTNFIVWLE